MCFAKGIMMKEVTAAVSERHILQSGLWIKVNTITEHRGIVA